MEAETGSRLAGEAASFVVGLVNPATDIQATADLITEIGTDIIDEMHDSDNE